MKNKKNLSTLLNKDISLSSDHHYILKENNSKQIFTQSVTDIIEGHFKEFDADLISKSLAKYASKYKGMDPYDIRQEWEKKKVHGSRVHTQIEKYILNKKKPTFTLSKIGVEWFDNNYQKYGDEYFSEVKVFSEEHEIGGTVDLLIYNKEKDGCYIFDWKTSGSDIHKSRGKGITSVTSDLKDCKFTTFELQLSIYKYLLQEIHGIKIINHFVLHLQDSGTDLIKTKYYKSHCIKMLKDLPEEDALEEDYYDDEYDSFEEYTDSDEYKAEIKSAVRTIQKNEYKETIGDKVGDGLESIFGFLFNSGILWWGGIILFLYWVDNC